MAPRMRIKKRLKRGKACWVVDWREGGKRHRKFFPTRDAADSHVAASKPEGGEPRRVLAGRELRKYETMLDILNGASPIEAALFFKQAKGPKVERRITEALGETVSAKRAAGKSKSYLQHFEPRIQALADRLGDPKCSEVTHSQIEQWLHSVTTWGQFTKTRVLIDVRTFFAYALKHGYCLSNPALKVEALDVGEREKGILTPAQARAFVRSVAETDKRLVRYFVDQLFGGLREDEARNLKADSVKENYIELLETKPGLVRYPEINATWKAWRTIAGDYAMEEKPILNLWRRVESVKEAAKEKMVKGKLVPADWWFPRNCLRHSFSTYAAKQFGSTKAAELAGHSEAIQKKHYKRPVTADEAKAFWSILP